MNGDKPKYKVPLMEEIEQIPWNGYNVVSTFSGGGGSCLGYRMSGYNVVWANEYYKIKGENSYTQDQIQAKRKSLEGVLVPITAKWNEQLLESAGFKKIDCFYRYLNFAGWLAIK